LNRHINFSEVDVEYYSGPKKLNRKTIFVNIFWNSSLSKKEKRTHFRFSSSVLTTNGFQFLSFISKKSKISFFLFYSYFCFLFQIMRDKSEKKKANLQSKGVDNKSGANCIEGWRYKFSLRFSVPIKPIFRFDYGLEQVATLFSIKSCFFQEPCSSTSWLLLVFSNLDIQGSIPPPNYRIIKKKKKIYGMVGHIHIEFQCQSNYSYAEVLSCKSCLTMNFWGCGTERWWIDSFYTLNHGES
jgi:hypothetical protein